MYTNVSNNDMSILNLIPYTVIKIDQGNIHYRLFCIHIINNNNL